MKTKRLLIALTVLVLAALACQVGTAPLTMPQLATPVANQPAAPAVNTSAQAASQQDAMVSLYQTVSPGVVTIQVATQNGGDLGSGFVFDTDGHIVTNYHVVQGAANNKVEVDFMSGFKTYGTVVGAENGLK
ncbi:MAG: S1C family serine protease, partial [Chloroflexi bacterium]|nr:S1C family serine protease [Chloroflexota bacterium]